MRRKVVIIGSGNVATQFGRSLAEVANVVQVFSPTDDHARRLAQQLPEADAVTTIDDVRSDADIYIVAVKDDSIPSLIDKFSGCGGLWLHTSGTTPMSVFEEHISRYGVIYPLQTLTRTKRVAMADVPLFIEANSAENLAEVKMLAQAMGAQQISECTSEKRMKLHVAAVFACNFVNNMLMYSQKLLREAGSDITALSPLIRETMDKALAGLDLESVQTGPARRGDCRVIELHTSALDGESREVYKFLSEIILNHYKDYE